jgi:hypothetical protein
MSELDTADAVAAYVGGGLVVVGVVVVGLVEMVAGSPHPVSGEGQIVHEALVPLSVRSYLVLLGLLVWAGYAAYRVVGTTPATADRTG